MNQDLKSLATYFASNKLSLNVKKCEAMLCRTRQRIKDQNLNVKINDAQISQSIISPYLGFNIDQYLTWSSHIDKLASKLSSKLGVLRKLRSYVPKDTLLLLYNALVLPHFDYADAVYDSASNTDLDHLQKLQSRAARIVTGSNAQTSRERMFKSLGWLSLQTEEH
jgi:hypothetical protein